MQKQFCNTGFIIADLIDARGLKDLTAAYNDTHRSEADVFQSSNYQGDTDLNRAIDASVTGILQPYLNEVLVNYQPVIGMFYVKPHGRKSRFYDHYDWTLVDESISSSMNIWVPLTDSTPANGNLYMYTNSNRSRLKLRGSPDLQHPREGFQKRISDLFSRTDVYPKAGQAVFFDHRMKHGSRKNTSGESRVAAGLSIIPDQAQLIHYHRTGPGEVVKFEVDKDFFTEYDLHSYPEGQKELEKIRL